MSCDVEAVTWKIPGRFYEKICKRLIDDEVEFIHAGIIFHGFLYEFCNHGVKKTAATLEGDPISATLVAKFKDRRKLGSSTVSLRMFDTWIAEEKRESYAKERYSLANNNCIHFALAVSKFLSVEEHCPKEWKKICDFTEKNKWICGTAHYFGKAVGSVIQVNDGLDKDYSKPGKSNAELFSWEFSWEMFPPYYY